MPLCDGLFTQPTASCNPVEIVLFWDTTAIALVITESLTVNLIGRMVPLLECFERFVVTVIDYNVGVALVWNRPDDGAHGMLNSIGNGARSYCRVHWCCERME